MLPFAALVLKNELARDLRYPGTRNSAHLEPSKQTLTAIFELDLVSSDESDTTLVRIPTASRDGLSQIHGVCQPLLERGRDGGEFCGSNQEPHASSLP